MDFDFTSDQVMLRNTVREYLTDKCTSQFVRSMFDDQAGYSKAMWKEMADNGWLGLTFPEDNGGLGLGQVELSMILEEMGRAVLPSPYFASVVLAGAAIADAGDKAQKDKYLGGIGSGELIATMGWLEDATSWGPGAINLKAESGGGGFVLNGLKRFVPFAHVADVAIVAARTSSKPDGITLFAVDMKSQGVATTPVTNMDLTSKAAEVSFSNVRVPEENVIGDVDGGWPVLKRLLDKAAVSAAAEMLGASRKSMEMSVDYAKVRETFGQPIGTFQAIKHMAADMLVEVESSHGAVYYASWAQAAGAPDASLAASVAKAYVGDASRKVCGDSIQLHGGIGFTWEFDLHLYFKRAKYYEPMFGDADYHREQALRTLEAETK
ncbi:MAG: acyl-CoA/acyl-ACP dehydrogenase [Chloroflexi bacterium]|nr:acyl-CoA/acyl-ACP dehydrogenase [Chloroflexota bacterium]